MNNESNGITDSTHITPNSVSESQPEFPNQDFLRSSGLSDHQIEELAMAVDEKRKKEKVRAEARNLPQQVRIHREAIIAHHGGRALLNAVEVHAGLVSVGVCREGENTNGVGGSLGKGKGLHLPSRSVNGKRYYAMWLIDASNEEKDAAQVQLNALSKLELLAAAGINRI